MNSDATASAPLAARLWAYQRERFPLAAYVPLIGISAAAAAGYSSAARGQAGLPPWPVLLVGVATGIAFFFLLRVADEHKDAHVDRQFRPELPVPRGLVSLAELRRAGAAAALAVVLANALVAPRLLLALVPAALWAGLMAREFFVAEWLRARPAAYLLSHMMIMPLLFTYLTGLDWLAAGADPPRTLPLFLGLAFLNGILVEIGRKIRAPRDEREGVETYTATWGVRAAPTAWLGALLLAALLGALAAPAAVADAAAIALALLGIAAALPAIAFLRLPSSARARRIETAAGLWTLASYLLLALTPYLFG
jgi:4-hydroxybenzoate polyprenyltransferase